MMRHNSEPEPPFLDLDARPQPIRLPMSQTAVVVVDMQNDFAMAGANASHCSQQQALNQQLTDDLKPRGSEG